MKFYCGLHHPGHAVYLDRAFISFNRVRDRKSIVPSRNWIMDSGAFSELERFGKYRESPETYAKEVNRIVALNPAGLQVIVSQDWMCEPFMLERTGLPIGEHQRLTIERYDVIRSMVPNVHVMPVLQGYKITDYCSHLQQYGNRLWPGMHVGVGSLCKRNGIKPDEIMAVVRSIKQLRPDLKLHGFGLKKTALREALIRDALYSADSMAWSWAARRRGGDANDWQEAKRFAERMDTMAIQEGMEI
jgi:hypothetical protein